MDEETAAGSAKSKTDMNFILQRGLSVQFERTAEMNWTSAKTWGDDKSDVG